MAKKQDPAAVGWEDSYITSFRVPYGVWQSAKLKAVVEGIHLSDVIEQFLRSWTDAEYASLAKRRVAAVDALRAQKSGRAGASGPSADPTEE